MLPALLLLISCTPSVPAGAAILTLDPDAVRHPTGRLIGWNLGSGTRYAPVDDRSHPEWRTDVRQRAIAELATIRSEADPPLMRFSGRQIDGLNGQDGYHFLDFAHPETEPAATDSMAVHQYMALIDEVGADPLVTLNFGSGTVSEATSYARYLNSDDLTDDEAAFRTFWGQSRPYDQPVFEIGNEPYGAWNTGFTSTGPFSYANPSADHGGDPDWHDRPAESAADAALRGIAYMDAVTAVSPDARFWWPISRADFTGWGGPTAAVSQLAPLLEDPRVEAVAIHHYQVDDTAALGVTATNAMSIAVGGSTFLEPGYHLLQDELATLNRSEPMQIAVSEFGVAGYFASSDFRLGHTAAMGLGTADMLIAFANWGVSHSTQQIALSFDDTDSDPLLEDWYHPYRFDDEGEIFELPIARVTRLFGDFMLPAVLDQSWDNNDDIRAGDGSEESPLFFYKTVHVAAFASEDGNRISLVLLNRDTDEVVVPCPDDAEDGCQPEIDPGNRPVRVELPGDWVLVKHARWAPRQWNYNVHYQDQELEDPRDPNVPIDDAFLRHNGHTLDVDLGPNSVVGVLLERN